MVLSKKLKGKMWGGKEADKELEMLSMDERSSYNNMSMGILPSLGAHTTRKPTKLRPSIISPFDHRYRGLQTFLLLLVFYTAWVSPFEFGFLQKPNHVLSIADNIVNGFFAIDIVLTFFVTFLDKATYILVDNHKLIAWRYLKTWFILDVIATIPSELARKALPDNLQAYGYFSLLRLWRLRRVSAMFARLEKDRNYSYIWVRVSKLTFVTLFAVHCCGCVFYLLAARNPDPASTWFALHDENFHQESIWDRYVVSMYWSITTVTTTGYGDLLFFFFFFVKGDGTPYILLNNEKRNKVTVRDMTALITGK